MEELVILTKGEFQEIMKNAFITAACLECISIIDKIPPEVSHAEMQKAATEYADRIFMEKQEEGEVNHG